MQSGTLHQELKELHDRYGPIVRIAPDELSYIDARAWKDIYNANHGHHVMEKNRVWTKQEEAKAPQSIVSTDESVHLRNRRALAGAFTEHAIAEHASVLELLVGLMISKFKEKVAADKGTTVVNMVDWMNFLAFDISGTLSFGESFDSVKNGKAHAWVDISCTFGKGVALMASVNFFSPLHKLLHYAIPAKVLEKVSYHKELAQTKVQQRLAMQDRTERQDYVASILQYNREKGAEVIPPDEIENNMTLLVFAGSETTSSAMSAILNQLMRNPEALQRASAEVRSAFGDEDEILVANVTKLEYLTAIIKEGIRLCPPAAIGLSRNVPKDGADICGQWVPGGVSNAPKHLLHAS